MDMLEVEQEGCGFGHRGSACLPRIHMRASRLISMVNSRLEETRGALGRSSRYAESRRIGARHPGVPTIDARPSLNIDSASCSLEIGIECEGVDEDVQRHGRIARIPGVFLGPSVTQDLRLESREATSEFTVAPVAPDSDDEELIGDTLIT
jgi:hypothetical protein